MTAPAATRRPGRRRPLPRLLLRSVLGDVLRLTRRDQGRTLADVAAAATISVPYLSEVERGRKEVSSEVLAALCDALAVPLSEVLAEVGRRLDAELAERARLERVEAVRELRARGTGTTSATSAVPALPAWASGGGDVLCLAA